MNYIRKIGVLLLVMLVGIASLGCNESNEEVKPQETINQTSESAVGAEISYKDTIIYALWSSPDGLFNPAISSTVYDEAVNELIYDSLITYDKDMNTVPAMASSYMVSEDGKTIVFDLRDDIFWHDGQKVTPVDIVFTLESLANGKYTGAYGNIVERIKGYDDYKAGKVNNLSGITVDGYKIVIQLEEVYAPALMNIGQFGILPKHIWSEVAIGDWQTASDLLSSPIGCGPYKFSDFEEGHHLKLQANTNYYRGEVATENFIFKIANRDNIQIQLENGEVDIAEISDMKPSDIEVLKTSGLKTVSFTNNLIQYMGFNLRDEKFQDNRVRKAFMHAIDRQLMVDALVAGKGKIINTPMIPTNWAYPQEDSLNPYVYDVELAKELLKEAGWVDQNQDGVLENEEGHDFRIVLTYPSGDKSREESAPIIQNYLKEVGVAVDLEMLEFKATMKKVVGDHEFDIYLMGNSIGEDPDPKPYWHSKAASDEMGVYGWNIAGFKMKRQIS